MSRLGREWLPEHSDSQPGHQGLGKWYPYNAMVEIDVSVAGVRTTHNFFCHGDTILMKALPVGMR
jgi:hypothetical protein